jgi:hypothetical protein
LSQFVAALTIASAGWSACVEHAKSSVTARIFIPRHNEVPYGFMAITFDDK